jgi:diadenosine tetraphosphate (Ap4A) HIT family hydrolase
VLHAHVHVVPRYEGDGFKIDAPAWRYAAPGREALDTQAARIRHALEELPDERPV